MSVTTFIQLEQAAKLICKVLDAIPDTGQKCEHCGRFGFDAIEVHKDRNLLTGALQRIRKVIDKKKFPPDNDAGDLAAGNAAF